MEGVDTYEEVAKASPDFSKFHVNMLYINVISNNKKQFSKTD
jgi:hypothetical protein